MICQINKVLYFTSSNAALPDVVRQSAAGVPAAPAAVPAAVAAAAVLLERCRCCCSYHCCCCWGGCGSGDLTAALRERGEENLDDCQHPAFPAPQRSPAPAPALHARSREQPPLPLQALPSTRHARRYTPAGEIGWTGCGGRTARVDSTDRAHAEAEWVCA